MRKGTMRRGPKSPAELEARLAGLETLDRDGLARAWAETFGVPAPHRASRELLLKAVAHRLQVRAGRDLPAPARRALLRLGRQISAGDRDADLPRPASGIKAGARLIRAFRGETHEVTVRGEGAFEWRGASYGSLSEIATRITGTRRNGPAFFGLRAGRGA